MEAVLGRKRFVSLRYIQLAQRLVVELVDAMTDTPANVSEDLYARLRNEFSEEQLMQLGAQIAFENYRARWNRIFNVESDHVYMPKE